MSTDDNNVSVCANCGKKGLSENMNTCNKCKTVIYCNAACKKKHKHKHNKQCEEHQRLAAERAVKLHDEELFKQPLPQYGDCPICFLRIPSHVSGYKYMVCCGKRICSGCIHAPLYDNQGNKVDNRKCAFCRVPYGNTYAENIKRYNKRVDVDDPVAIYSLGDYHRDGSYGYPQDYTKALEMWHRAGELGYADSYNNIGYAYNNGEGVVVDKKKAKHYYEQAAMGGDVAARHNLAIDEEDAGNVDRALKHYMIAVRCGNSESLKCIQDLYSEGQASKEEYRKALQSYQEYLGEIKSRQRDEAAAAREDYRYY